MSEAQHLIDRFMHYVAVSTQSNSKAATVPSNPNEIQLAELLAKELTAMGMTDVEISVFGCLTGKLPSNLSAGPVKRPLPSAGARIWIPWTAGYRLKFTRI